jgi:hypothetical protein
VNEKGHCQFVDIDALAFELIGAVLTGLLVLAWHLDGDVLRHPHLRFGFNVVSHDACFWVDVPWSTTSRHPVRPTLGGIPSWC